MHRSMTKVGGSHHGEEGEGLVGQVVPESLHVVRPLMAVVLIQVDPMLHVIILHQVVKAGGDIRGGLR